MRAVHRRRWEHDKSEVSPFYREPLARELKLTLQELDALLNGNSALPRPQQGWWSNYETLEQSATSVRTWEPVVVPGLLQTREYAAALLGDNDRVIRRMDRQRILTRPGNPVEMQAIIDQSVLLRPVGGAEVLVRQLDHLVAITERPNVTVQVLPLDAAAQALKLGAPGAFVILGFPWPGGLVYLEHQKGAHSLDSFHDLEAHILSFDQLRDLALSPTDSLKLIDSMKEIHQ